MRSNVMWQYVPKKQNYIRAVSYFCSGLIFATMLFTKTNAETEFINNSDVQSGNSRSYNTYIASLNEKENVKAQNSEIVIIDNKTTIKESDSISVRFTAESSGLFTCKMDYSVTSDAHELKLAAEIDNSVPYEEMNNISLPIYYSDVNKDKKDSVGNEIAADTAVKYGDYTNTLRNTNNTDYLYTYIEKVIHTLTLKSQSADVVLKCFSFSYEPSALSYKEY